jgi:hypothetical protein
MRLDDLQIERYSRQIVLPELGAEGQRRLLSARVALTGVTAVTGHVVEQLAAAGVGIIAAPTALHDNVDPGQTDSRAVAIAAAATPFDVAVHTGDDVGPVPAARHVLWVRDGRVGETPPCDACAAAALPAPAAPAPELAPLRDALLGAVVATEVVKRLAGIGDSLRGQVLTYDPDVAQITLTPIAGRTACARCAALAPVEH